MAQMPLPKVSICIPTYNRRHMLRAALWSVLRQTYQDFEVIISDNDSAEDIETEVIAFKDPRVRYFRQKKNIGGVANFVFLQTLARGDYVLFLGSDDLLLPNCLAVAVTALEFQPHCGGAVYMAAHYSDEGFQSLTNMPARNYAGASEYENDREVKGFRYASPSLCLYRRINFERIGGWDPNLLAVIDYDLYARMIRDGGGVIFLHEVLAITRLHENRMSNTCALQWGFYHDAMLMTMRPQYPYGNAYRATALVEQLLWDWRLKKSPWQTLKHAHNMKAFPRVLLHLPWELLRRILLKVRRVVDRRDQGEASASSKWADNTDLDGLERFWQASEMVRTQDMYHRGYP